ncbi:hypothetical protein J3A83DRAFT_3198495 [Scleroderma citrinum]
MSSASPSIASFLSLVKEGLTFLLISSCMGSVLFMMLLALFFFATPTLRRKPIFILNVIAVALGITYSSLWIYIEIHAFQTGVVFNPEIVITTTLINGFTPLFVDCVLLLRLMAVFPRRSTPPCTWFIVLGIPVIIKVFRCANITFFLVSEIKRINSLPRGSFSSLASALFNMVPSVKIEWIIQVFDDLFSSVPFLWRLHKDGVFIAGSSFSTKIKQIFWISAYNFVFPVILSVAQIVSYMASKDYVLAMYFEQVNIHFTIIGLVFATVWAAERHWEDAQRKDRSVASRMSTICFSPPRQHVESRGEVFVAKSPTHEPSGPGSNILDSPHLVFKTARDMRDERGIV